MSESPDGTLTVVANTQLYKGFLEHAQTFWSSQHSQTNAVGGVCAAADSLRYSHSFFNDDSRQAEAHTVLENTLGADAANVIHDVRKKVNLVFLLNSPGGQWQCIETMVSIMRNIRFRHGEIIGFMGNVMSGAARLVNCMDRVYASDKSSLLYHDVRDVHTGEIHAHSPFVDETDVPTLEEVLQGVSEPHRTVAQAKVKAVKADPQNRDNTVEFTADELPGFLKTGNWEWMKQMFYQETGVQLSEDAMQHDERSRLLYIWSQWSAYRHRVILHRSPSDNIQDLCNTFLHTLQEKLPGITHGMLRECINGDPEGVRRFRIETGLEKGSA